MSIKACSPKWSRIGFSSAIDFSPAGHKKFNDIEMSCCRSAPQRRRTFYRFPVEYHWNKLSGRNELNTLKKNIYPSRAVLYRRCIFQSGIRLRRNVRYDRRSLKGLPLMSWQLRAWILLLFPCYSVSISVITGLYKSNCKWVIL